MHDLRVAGTGVVQQALERVASSYSHLLSAHGGRFACMRALENQLPVPRADVGQVVAWFGDVKKFAHIDLLVKIIVHGVPVDAGGVGDLDAALVYGNHSSIGPYEENITSKIADDVRLGRALVFPREAADRIPGLHVSPLGVTLSPS